jgi:hypothetical protein
MTEDSGQRRETVNGGLWTVDSGQTTEGSKRISNVESLRGGVIGRFKLGRYGRFQNRSVKSFLPYNLYRRVVQGDSFPDTYFRLSISEYARPVSLGPAALREWALRKLVGAIAAAS